MTKDFLSISIMCFLRGVVKVDVNTETYSVIQWLDSDGQFTFYHSSEAERSQPA